MLRHNRRFTLAQTAEAGAVLRERANGRLQVRHQQRGGNALARHVRHRQPERRRPNGSASKQSPPTPLAGCHDEARSQAGYLRERRRQQAALDQARLFELALLLRVAPLRRPRLVDLALQDLEERDVFPWLLDEARAPRRIASTAVSMLPQPVMTTIGIVASCARTCWISSSPLALTSYRGV